ncbi:MAG: WecB/TagA/CpsF family glycosyltransferase [Clostridia bacterium]|nr:WecB/TagA/CpsF family glycosyltransferase [Clostridia bacterium]
MRKTVDILGVHIDQITMADALTKAKKLLGEGGVSAIYTPNPEIIMAAYENEDFRAILNGADICTPDGIGVVYASRMLNHPVPERVPGFDLTCGLLEHISKTGEGVFLFGAKPGIAEIARANLEKKYPGLVVSGVHDGYFKEGDEPEIIRQINESGAKLLLVCLGAPKQEMWIHQHRAELNVSLCMGVGGSLDVFAGTVKRAPDLFIKLNLEWFYRLLKQPSRIGRFMALPKFILTVAKKK